MNLNPIIQALANTEEPLLRILEKHINNNQYLEVVFLRLVKTHINETLDLELLLKLDQAVINGHPDMNVFLLFMARAVLYTGNFRQTEKAKALFTIGNASLNKNTHLLVQAEWMQAKARLLTLEGNRSESLQLMTKAMKLIGEKNSRYKTILVNLALILAEQGQLKELKSFDLTLLNTPLNSLYAYSVIEIKLLNSINICDCKSGYELIDEHRKKCPNRWVNQIEIAVNELDIISGNLDEINYQIEPFKIIVRIYNSLLYLKIDDAIKWHQLLLNKTCVIFNPRILDEYIALQIELYLGNKGKVRLLLKEKAEKRMSHYMDDFFLGRLHLLEKNEVGANIAFSRLIENINRYGAMNRLLFELQFAKEMKLLDVLRLTQGWKIDKKNTQEKKTNSVKMPELNFKGLDLIIGHSSAINQVKELIKKYAPLKVPVLITGETGTGKELVSRAIHDEGLNSQEPFLAINCGALTESLLQSELYGYVAGAFTGAQKERKGIFEAAGKGTVFLDEFGDISPLLQVSLLRLIESNEIRMIGGTVNRKIECRLIIATNIDLKNAVIEKEFREDLYFRLIGFEIRIPALRERIGDLSSLIEYFLHQSKEDTFNAKKINSELLNALSAYHWPGNIRELKNEIEKLKILNYEKEVLGMEDFDFAHLQGYLPKAITNEHDLVENKLAQMTIHNNQEIDITSNKVIKIIKRESKVERRILLIKALFKQYKILTRSKIIEITNVNPATATKELQRLCNEGYILRHMPTNSPSTYYFELAQPISNDK